MDQDKFIKLQLQMKQNNEDYKDFLEGIESWSHEIKDKEGKLNTGTESHDSYPIRNATVKVKRDKKQKIKAYDYAAWDKFDVDNALNDDEKSNDDDEGQSEARMEQLVKEHREVGNIRFKEGNYTEATAEYTRAILCDGSNAILYNNRAMSLLKMGKYEAAEVDCCKAVEIDNTLVKAFYRRSKCRLMLQRKDEALDDLYAVLRLDPSNKIAQKEMHELEKDLNIRGIVMPIFGAAKKGVESSAPLVRVNIVDVDPNKPLADAIKDRSDFTATKIVCDTDKTMQIFTVPRTAVQLAKDLSKYRGNPIHRAKYVSQIDRTIYRSLIGHSLDSKLLQDFIDGLSLSLEQSIITDVDFVENINYLAQVDRFASLWLMMTDDDKRQFKAALYLVGPQLSSTLDITL